MIWFEVLRVSRHAPNTSLIGNSALPGPYSRTLHRDLWWVLGGGGLFHERGTPVLPRHYPFALGAGTNAYFEVANGTTIYVQISLPG